MNAATGEARRFPWDDVIALGLGLLRLSSRDFWAMTPMELAHVVRARSGRIVAAPERSAVETLRKLFPDRQKGQRHGG